MRVDYNPAKGQKDRKTEAAIALVVVRKAQLDSLGFIWDKNSKVASSWDEWFAQLETFHKLHGHCKVAKQYDAEKAPGLRV